MATITSRQALYLGHSAALPPLMVGGIGIPGFIREAASQTYVAGAIVHLAAATGKVTATADADNVADLWGIALGAATGVTDTPVLARLFRPGDIYAMHLETSGAQTYTADIDDIGEPVEFNIAGGYLMCDKNSVQAGGTAVDRPTGVIRAIYCKEHGYPTTQVLGDTHGLVVVELLPSAHLHSIIS